jgi:hypothetical protein
MSKAWFTEEELRKMTVKQLRVVSEYYDIPSSGIGKDGIIKAILHLWEEGDEQNNSDLPPMSVQARRIYDSLKEVKG